MATDRRFGWPNLFQSTFPHIFLTGERWIAPIAARLLPRRRPFDDMALSLRVPWEDEAALSGLCGLSPMIGSVFPSGMPAYRRFLTLQDVTDDELQRWKRALILFMKKLTLKDRRQLVLKSPAHTARIPVLLDLFPEAHFVHIHRHPYAVMESTRNMMRHFGRVVQLERTDLERLDEEIVASYRVLYAAYFDTRGLIPDGHLSEVSFEHLERRPLAHLERIYAEIGLPDFSRVRGAVTRYLHAVRPGTTS
ncbi:MAG: sulfotransferase [bacterium]|nr:sulfotransferase [bacterium]